MQRLLIIGAGFAGMHAALSAARLRALAPDELRALLVDALATPPAG